MIILEPGNPNWDKRYRRFTCSNCGCIFVAESHEYQYDQHDGYSCKCPCCHSYAYKNQEYFGTVICDGELC